MLDKGDRKEIKRHFCRPCDRQMQTNDSRWN